MMLQPLFLSLILANPQALLERAQSNINESNWSEAAKILDEYVRTETKPTVEAMYDCGVAHYNLGEYEVATKSFEDAMNTAQDPMLQTFSAFNYGNALYQQTLTSLEGTGTGAPSSDAIIALEDAQAKIRQVLSSYRTAIALDQSDMDARANGELAWQMLQQLNQMQEQMEEQQEEQQQEDEQQQNQDEESADEQEENQEQKQDGSSEQEQQKQDGESSDEGEQSEGQQQDGQQEQQKNKEGEQSEQNQQEQEQNGEQSENQQEGAQSNQQPEEEGEQQEPQNSLDGELEATDEQMNEMKTPSTSLKDEGERLSEDEANRLLQLIRDKEQQRRKAIAAKKAANRVPVGKDW